MLGFILRQVKTSLLWGPLRLVVEETGVRGGYLGAADFRRTLQYVKRGFALLIIIPLAFFLYLILVLINCFRPIRIGTLSAKGRISIMVSYLEPYLRNSRLDGLGEPWVIVINPGGCPNEQLSKMYGRAVWLLDDRRPRLRALFSTALRFFVSGSPIEVRLADYTSKFVKAWQEGSPVVGFTADESQAGRLLLATIGIAAESSYICFGLRDSVYYRQFLTPESQARHPNTEAGEDTYIRNPPLKNYIPMAVLCAERGLYVLRMGQVVGEPLPGGLHPNIIDYTTKYRTPFGDIYLLATCKFVVGGASGLWWVSSAFNRPVVLTDSYYFQVRPPRQGDLFIAKKLWLISERRFLTFREMLDAGMRYSYESNCRRDGLELLHNTPEEIAAVVDEMNRRLDGTWETTDEDEELQRRFEALYLPAHYGYRLPGKIGAQFLRENKHLLD